jgi:transposase-like protein
MANAYAGGIMRLAKPGDFCPNKACPAYQKLQDDQRRRNIIKVGKTKKGAQRYECKTCGRSFTETFGTLFYNKRTPADGILETLALLAEGSRMSSLTRAKGFKEDTILGWLREAAHHAEALEDVLLKDFRVRREQLDGLWAYVRYKGEKRTSRNV